MLKGAEQKLRNIPSTSTEDGIIYNTQPVSFRPLCDVYQCSKKCCQVICQRGAEHLAELGI